MTKFSLLACASCSGPMHADFRPLLHHSPALIWKCPTRNPLVDSFAADQALAARTVPIHRRRRLVRVPRRLRHRRTLRDCYTWRYARRTRYISAGSSSFPSSLWRLRPTRRMRQTMATRPRRSHRHPRLRQYRQYAHCLRPAGRNSQRNWPELAVGDETAENVQFTDCRWPDTVCARYCVIIAQYTLTCNCQFADSRKNVARCGVAPVISVNCDNSSSWLLSAISKYFWLPDNKIPVAYLWNGQI